MIDFEIPDRVYLGRQCIDFEIPDGVYLARQCIDFEIPDEFIMHANASTLRYPIINAKAKKRAKKEAKK